MNERAQAKVAILSTSFNSESRSRSLAQHALELLQRRGVDAAWLDLRTFTLPFCGDDAAWGDPEVSRLRAALTAASHILFAVPIYNYDVNAAAKNVVELMGKDVFGGKTIGFLCAAGGANSYMSVLPFANSLMLDFRCWIVPRFVYATGGDFSETAISNTEIHGRIEGLINDLLSHPAAV